MSTLISSQYILDRVKANTANNVRIQNERSNNKGIAGVNSSFEQVYNKIAQQGVNISKHAYNRIKTRNINLSEEELTKVSKAMDKAKGKGIKDALIMLNNNVLIANIKNSTIVTVADKSDLKEDIITNIDGAIIL